MDDNNSDAGSTKGKQKLSRLLSRRSKRSKTASSKSSSKKRSDSSTTLDSSHPGRQWNAGTQHDVPGTPTTPGESLVTSDSDDDDIGYPSSPPPPLPSQSTHKGFPVATSPKIQANTITTITSESGRSPAHSPAHADTLPIHTSEARSKPVPGVQHGWTMGGKLGVDQSSNRSSSRSVSPGSRIKDAFKISSRRSSPSKESLNGSEKEKERQSRPGTKDGERPQSQPIPRPATKGSTYSLPMTLNSNGTDSSIPPVPPIPISPPQIAINGTGLSSRPSLSSVTATNGTPSNPPFTTVTPPTPDIEENQPRTPPSRQSPKLGSSSPTPSASAHRRTRSDGSTKAPSKLSQSMNAPLSPMEEEPPSVRLRNTSNGSAGSASGGFFSSMFSAAQNMTNSFTNMGGNPSRPRTGTTGSVPESIPEERDGAEAQATHEGEGENESGETEAPKELAIDTMGSGNLSLSHLGIMMDSPQAMATPQSAGTRSRSGTQVRHEEAAAKAEDEDAAKAITAAYQNAPNLLDRPATAVAEDASADTPKPGSMYEGSIDAKTPPNGSVYEDDINGSGVIRSGSLREKIVDRRRRKHRNSSTTTIGAAISASHTTLASPGRNSSSQKLDGFTYANRKRDKEYHQLFRSVPEDDHLLEDYSCALQRDIILAGRIYVSEGHICFSSNILGWVTNLVISFEEIVAVDKESTAMVFPNAIAIQTLHARHTFRSLLSREATYDLIISIWKTSHPNLQSTETGTKLLSAADAAAAAAAAAAAKGGSESDSGLEDEDGSEDGSDDDDDDDGDDHDGARSTNSKPMSDAASDLPPATQSSPTRKVSNMAQEVGAAANPGPTASNPAASSAAAGAAAAAEKDYPGPATHASTECSDAASHFENALKDDVIQAPLGKVYSMTFGPASGGFMSRWLMDEAKCWDIEVQGGGQLKALDDSNKSRNYTYMKPLNAPIGPKQTKCVVSEQLDAFDLDKAVSVTVTTQTPDVPSGNVFSVKTKYCLSWASNNSTRIQMNFTIEWTGKSWIKGPIEKGAKDGQGTYADDLVRGIRAGISSGSKGPGGSKKKSKKSKKGGDGTKGSADGGPAAGARGGRGAEPNWGLLEPIRPLLGPVVEPFAPLFSARMMAGFFAFLLIVTWFRNSRLRTVVRESDAIGGPGVGPLSNLRAGGHHGFEHVWRSEEDALWKWLEHRVGLQDGVPGSVGGKKVPEEKSNADSSKQARKERQKVLKGRGLDLPADVSGMSKREIKFAVKATEEKLEALKRIVGMPDGNTAAAEPQAE